MRSMTGYGTAEGQVGKGRLFVEIKSVNHRFCDINLKLPPKMGVLEASVRRLIEKAFARGKIDIFFKEKTPLFGGMTLELDASLARQYQHMFKKLSQSLGLPHDLDFLRYVNLDRIIHLEEREGSYERMWKPIERLFTKAMQSVVRMQKREGAHILKDQRATIGAFERTVRRMQRETQRIFSQHESRVRKRIAGANSGETDEQRLQLEVAYLGSRQDIAEELTRLVSHIDQYRGLIAKDEPVGRKLDFLLQEMNREVNTIGSKAADAFISRLVVDGKSLLERLREQVQNVE